MFEFPVLGSAAWLAARAKFVFLNHDAVDSAVETWGHLVQKVPSWKQPFHYWDGTEETARWIFVLDVLNHCFWPDPGDPLWEVEMDGTWYSGYCGLAAALKKAYEEGTPLTNARYLQSLTLKDLEGILAGRGRIPLLRARLDNLREAGRVLVEKWRGDVMHLIAWAQGSACRLAARLVEDFPSFRDHFFVDGQTVYFWKRAQIFAADLHAAFEGQGPGRFLDMDRLTAFADYKLPQVLRELEILQYRDDLAQQIDDQALLASGCREEIEIRAMTLVAVEKLKDAFHRRGHRRITSVHVDHWLWSLGQLDLFRRRPYHRCRTIFY
ncbi:queuosine 5'-phosphate N-glycosylase/hydrolase [Desulfosoma caldarium]|uniref:Queuosine 5'-phosphate N-glycosylase/hydrolase n=1 Tax=Desulfosoma caldarium TaxID=610254 RepID=A0A3N1UY46_9BACT|nr:queuosine salvage family protein [Desulfosoma caldarium]ROQ93467.1 putative queuosine salvage protein [Desulfosoma caldarium]